MPEVFVVKVTEFAEGDRRIVTHEGLRPRLPPPSPSLSPCFIGRHDQAGELMPSATCALTPQGGPPALPGWQ